jgi:UDP-N-acetylmuramoyl-tripeptide--D-alanyl-D-alanine ligase
MLRKLKNALYFNVARYFRFFARIRLRRWKPRIVVVTGSNGKTTALHLMEVRLRNAARYSFGANSSFGIPFDILGLKRETYSPFEWAALALRAPLAAWKKPYAETVYVVEADCDRPGEGAFLSSLLAPEITVWLSSARTHSRNFDAAVHKGALRTIDEAIAYEFGYFIENTSKLAIINGDNAFIAKQLYRTKAAISSITRAEQFGAYEVGNGGSAFTVDGTAYRAPFLLPKETFYAVAASAKVAEYFGTEPTANLAGLTMPPGRSSIFKGIKNTTIIDSSYNANAESVAAILGMVQELPASKKWLILGDLTEQGAEEKEEHEKIARMVLKSDFDRIILVGPRLARYALPILKDAVPFDAPKDALDYLVSSIQGGETLVFKGARFLEGVIEHLLENKEDAEKLCRREKVWQKRRQQWQL